MPTCTKLKASGSEELDTLYMKSEECYKYKISWRYLNEGDLMGLKPQKMKFNF